MQHVQIAKNRQGWTLVETMVTLFISMIALTIVSAILLSVSNVSGRQAAMHHAKQVGDTVYAYLSKQLIYSHALQAVESGDSEADLLYENELSVRDGMLFCETPSQSAYNVYGESFYGGLTLRVETSLSGYVLSLTIDLQKAEHSIYTTGSSFELINLKLLESPAVWPFFGPLVNPRLRYSPAP